MTPEQVTAVITAVTALVVALGAIIVQLYQLHKSLNGRLSQLVDVTQKAALKQGELEGRDFATGQAKAEALAGPRPPEPSA